MNGPRRRLLTAAGSVAASLAGCLGSLHEPATETTDRRATTTDRRATTTVARDYSATVNATATVERDD